MKIPSSPYGLLIAIKLIELKVELNSSPIQLSSTTELPGPWILCQITLDQGLQHFVFPTLAFIDRNACGRIRDHLIVLFLQKLKESAFLV